MEPGLLRMAGTTVAPEYPAPRVTAISHQQMHVLDSVILHIIEKLEN